jgi:hypothetical protein
VNEMLAAAAAVDVALQLAVSYYARREPAKAHRSSGPRVNKPESS